MRNRSVVEIMVLCFTAVVAFMIVGLGFMIIYVEAVNPEADTGLVANTLMSLVSGILGALLGLIAGRGTSDSLHGRPKGGSDDMVDTDDTKPEILLPGPGPHQ